MAHTTEEKKRLLNRVRRIRGQVDAIERALDQEVECSDTLHAISVCRGAMALFRIRRQKAVDRGLEVLGRAARGITSNDADVRVGRSKLHLAEESGNGGTSERGK